MRSRNWVLIVAAATVSLTGCVSAAQNTPTATATVTAPAASSGPAGSASPASAGSAAAASATPVTTGAATALPQLLPGELNVDGDVGTLTPAEKVKFDASGADVLVHESFHGASTAYAELCSGRTDIVDSTTKISKAQLAACSQNGLQVVQFVIAADGDVVAIENDSDVGGDCMTTTQLKTIFRAGSPMLTWNQLGGGYLGVPLTVGGGTTSTASFALFASAALGSQHPSALDLRSDFHAFKTDDLTRAWVVPNFTGRGVPANGRVAFFPFSYYTLYEEQLRPFEITLPGSRNCIFPSQQTLLDGSYPLARQYLLTTTTRSLARNEAKLFLSHYIKDADTLASTRQLAQLPTTTVQTELAWVAGTQTPPSLGSAATPTATPTPTDTNKPAS